MPQYNAGFSSPFIGAIDAISSMSGGFVKTKLLMDRERRESERLKAIDRQWRESFDFKKAQAQQDWDWKSKNWQHQMKVYEEEKDLRALRTKNQNLQIGMNQFKLNQAKDEQENMGPALLEIMQGMDEFQDSEPASYAMNWMQHSLGIAAKYNLDPTKMLEIGKAFSTMAKVAQPKAWKMEENLLPDGKMGRTIYDTQGNALRTSKTGEWHPDVLATYKETLKRHDEIRKQAYDELKLAGDFYSKSLGATISIGQIDSLSPQKRIDAMMDLQAKLSETIEKQSGSLGDLLDKALGPLIPDEKDRAYFIERSGVRLSETKGMSGPERLEHHSRQQRKYLEYKQNELGANLDLPEFFKELKAHINNNANTVDDKAIAMQAFNRLKGEFLQPEHEVVPIEPLPDPEISSLIEKEFGSPPGTIPMTELGSSWQDIIGSSWQDIIGEGWGDRLATINEIMGNQTRESTMLEDPQLATREPTMLEDPSEDRLALPAVYDKWFNTLVERVGSEGSKKLGAELKQMIETTLAKKGEKVELPPVYEEMFQTLLDRILDEGSSDRGEALKWMIKHTIEQVID